MSNKSFKQLVLLFVIATASFSCENSDDSPLDTSGDLLGDWELISYTTNGNTSSTVQGNTATATFTGEALNIDYVITFSENPNKATTQNGSFDFELMSSIEGINSTETTSINNINSEADWTRNGNIIQFSDDFGTFETNATVLDEDFSANPDYIIEELTETSLVLTTSVSEQITESGISISINMSLRLTFTRV